YVSQSACRVFEIAGSKPAEDDVSGFSGARIEDAARGYQRILRFAFGWVIGTANGKAERHSGRVKGKLRTASPAGLDVLELFRAGKREAGAAATRERFARLPGRNGETVVGSVPEERREAGGAPGPFDSAVSVRLPKGAASGGKFAGQLFKTHAFGRKCDVSGEAPLLGTANSGCDSKPGAAT